MTNNAIVFPEGFLWGAATAAYQIEGATHEDDRGESIWDVFVRQGGSHNGDNAEIAADFYHRYPEDLRMLGEDYGLKGLRFSIAWPRIMPAGSGAVNQKGLDHYDRLIDRMLELGISPLCTLYHWDLPQALQAQGGWLNRDTSKQFADYAALVVARYADRIPRFVTLNEPWSAAFMGHAQGLHAPGLRNYELAGTAAHHLLLAHGLALEAIRAQNHRAQMGVTLWLTSVKPFSPMAEDVEAAGLADAESNRIWLDALLRGKYPEQLLKVLPQLGDERLVKDGDLARISQPLDFFGLNYYVREIVKADRGVPLLGFRRLPPPGPTNYRGDTLQPDGVEEILSRPLLDYGCTLPVYCTEIGNAFNDYVDPTGRVRDRRRIDYFDEAFRAVHRAIARGVDVRGLFVWTLLDDFEWDAGFSARYGITFVDYGTQKRTPKDSAYWLRDVVQRNGLLPAGGVVGGLPA
jgi:beta-glucosidase